MELRLTTKRVLEFENRTGKDVLKLLQEIAKTNEVSIKDIVELFIACGENYTVEMFDMWDIPFVEKTQAIMDAVSKYLGTQSTPKK
nr:MAG TPA: tail tube protein [Caudoviricetes sp.]